MKFNIEDYLYNIDQALAEKKQQEVYAIYLLIIAAPIFLSYYFLWDSAENGFKQTQKERIALEKKIADDNQYLMAHPESMITQIENETKAIEASFIQYQDSNAYIKYQIEQISSLFYDEQAWGEYLDSIAENAKKYSIKLNVFSNKFAENKEAFGHVLDINVECEGKFHNMVKFVNSLEQSFLVVDIHDFTVGVGAEDEKKRTRNRLQTNLTISVWGITY